MRRLVMVFALLVTALPVLGVGEYRVLAWNELGMHCADGDFSVAKNSPPVTAGTTVRTSKGAAASTQILATDADNVTLTLRVVDKPDHGSAGLSGRVLTYTPDPGFTGSDSLTMAASDGSTDSNLATVSVVVVDPERRRPVRP